MGDIVAGDDLVQHYNTRASELMDDDYKKLEVNPCEVKDIQNTEKGVYGFWLKAILNHSILNKLVQEKDRPILMHLQDVQSKLHPEGFGFDLLFKFEKNDYFSNEVLRKRFTMSS